jgi:hypothetical protein
VVLTSIALDDGLVVWCWIWESRLLLDCEHSFQEGGDMMLQPRGAGRQWPTLEFVYAEYDNKCSRVSYLTQHGTQLTWMILYRK